MRIKESNIEHYCRYTPSKLMMASQGSSVATAQNPQHVCIYVLMVRCIPRSDPIYIVQNSNEKHWLSAYYSPPHASLA